VERSNGATRDGVSEFISRAWRGAPPEERIRRATKNGRYLAESDYLGVRGGGGKKMRSRLRWTNTDNRQMGPASRTLWAAISISSRNENEKTGCGRSAAKEEGSVATGFQLNARWSKYKIPRAGRGGRAPRLSTTRSSGCTMLRAAPKPSAKPPLLHSQASARMG
jgi:hypothetical protein